MNAECSGYIVLGRIHNKNLELIAFKLPFGYTLLVEPQCIHGDSTLIGLYAMAMTGNHEAMNTADTVFIKNKLSGANVKFPLDLPKINMKLTENLLMITSDKTSMSRIIQEDLMLKKFIKNNLGIMQLLWWKPVILTLGETFGDNKTRSKIPD